MVFQALLQGIRVLIVDDNLDALDAVCTLLKLHGAEVECVGTGDEALQRLESFSPHVLLLDLTMPGMDGFELMRRVRNGRHASVPAIAFTGLSSEVEGRERAFGAGFQRYLTKPLDTQRLVDTVASLARTSAAAATASIPPVSQAAPPPRGWGENLPSLSGLRVTVVDDDEDTLDIVKVLLTARGAEVHAFHGVEEAMLRLTSARPHVILTDVAMPGADGTELLRRIRSRSAYDYGEVPVVALTAYGKEYRGAGFDAVLTKPPQPDLLVNVVYAAVRPVEVVLYISGGDASAHARESLGRIVGRFESSSLLCSVVSVDAAREQASADHVTATPALVRHHPRPVARLMGDLEDENLTAAVLESWGARERAR